MSYRWLLLGFAFVIAVVAPTAAFADDPLTPGEVVALGTENDGKKVVVFGEALGEVMRDGTGGYWLNVLGEGTGIGLWSARDIFAQITEFGDYHRRGQTVEAVGTYNAACDRHGGDRDVHVTSVRVVGDAQPIERPIRWWELGGGIGMAATAVAVSLWYRRHVERV